MISLFCDQLSVSSVILFSNVLYTSVFANLVPWAWGAARRQDAGDDVTACTARRHRHCGLVGGPLEGALGPEASLRAGAEGPTGSHWLCA